MDKFDLTESLRIYIPGVYCTTITNYLANLNLSPGGIGVLAIFVGLFIHSFGFAERFKSTYIKYGHRFILKTHRHNMFVERAEIFRQKFKNSRAEYEVLKYLQTCETDSFDRSVNVLSQTLMAFDAGRHHIQENKEMRLQSTLGYMKFLLGLISFVAFVLCIVPYIFDFRISYYKSIFYAGYEWLDLFILFFLFLLFIHGAIRAKQRSLDFEKRLYLNYTAEDIKQLEFLVLFYLRQRAINSLTNSNSELDNGANLAKTAAPTSS
ncbi:hypothetical protein [Chryseolinea sp. H1M3-3]|uniref:hypothetical protein n=1 Tax=Chryseolinea sp. H1M3-3 TaxID=3034144 RepID=UPI0023EB7C56|nr:hypothetical protein [Chryseolinea sp. H1M3-3]